MLYLYHVSTREQSSSVANSVLDLTSVSQCGRTSYEFKNGTVLESSSNTKCYYGHT